MLLADRRRLPADFDALRFLSPVPPVTIAVYLNTPSSIIRGRRHDRLPSSSIPKLRLRLLMETAGILFDAA
jgi:hypothetical protein